MKKSDLRGFSNVFTFTLTQALKAKSFIITMIITVLFATGLFPFMAVINGSKNKEDAKPDKIIVYYDEADPLLVLTKFSDVLNEYAEGKPVEKRDPATFDSKKLSELAENEPENTIFINAYTSEAGSVQLDAYYNPGAKFDQEATAAFTDKMTEKMGENKLESLNVSVDTLKRITKNVLANDTTAKKYVSNKEADRINMVEYNIIYALLFVSYMIIIMTANMVSTKIVEEKTNRIVEYLMTTVRPMALILGKVFAMMIVTVGELLLMLGGAVLGKGIAKAAFDYDVSEGGGLGSILSADLFKALTADKLLLAIVIVGIGIMIFSLIAGLFGATVSKMDEVQEGMKTFNMILIVSFMAGIGSLITMMTTGINSFVKATLLIPFTAVFVLPGAFMIGKASLATVGIAIGLEVVVALAILYFVSLVYESVIVMNGAPIGLKQMIDIAKGGRKNLKAKEESK